jgi:hypothetical protein
MPKVRVSKIVPPGFIGICLWPFGIYVSDSKYLTNQRIIRHESIHWEQQKELAGIFFYILYLVEWIVKLFFYKNKSYRNLAAEREAKKWEHTPDYLENRKRYDWLKYIVKKP